MAANVMAVVGQPSQFDVAIVVAQSWLGCNGNVPSGVRKRDHPSLSSELGCRPNLGLDVMAILAWM